MDKREMLKKVLGPFFKMSKVTPRPPVPCPYLDFDALAEKAIIVPVEVEHTEDLGQPYTAIVPSGRWMRGFWDLGNQLGHHGNPGENWAIIIPLEEEDGD